MAGTTLTYEELAEIVSKCVGVTVEPDAIGSPTVRFEEIGVDSLGVLSIVAELERRYRIALGAEAEESETLGELINLVNKHFQDGE